MASRRRVAILGSTGSIGTQALDVVARHRDRFDVVALAAGHRVADLRAQAERFRPGVVCCADEQDAASLRASLPDVRVCSGAAGLVAVAAESDADVVLAATDGAVAFDAIFAAAERGLTLAVANKEVVVAAGELLFAVGARTGAQILPVDSEHSALFQSLIGERAERVTLLVLTASGGPFWDLDAAAMRHVGVADALRHPTWNMGTKNTIDSATMMNKGLEVIEASRFFGVPGDRIAVLVHRTSVAHGFAVFSDGSVKGQFAAPDMRLPIGYALAYPDRLVETPPSDPLVALGAAQSDDVATLRFERPDDERFPCLQLAYDALRRGGTAPAALSAANEVAVRAFLQGRLSFSDIPAVIQAATMRVSDGPLTLDAVRSADARARLDAEQAVERLGGRRGMPPGEPTAHGRSISVRT